MKCCFSLTSLFSYFSSSARHFPRIDFATLDPVLMSSCLDRIRFVECPLTFLELRPLPCSCRCLCKSDRNSSTNRWKLAFLVKDTVQSQSLLYPIVLRFDEHYRIVEAFFFFKNFYVFDALWRKDLFVRKGDLRIRLTFPLMHIEINFCTSVSIWVLSTCLQQNQVG